MSEIIVCTAIHVHVAYVDVIDLRCELLLNNVDNGLDFCGGQVVTLDASNHGNDHMRMPLIRVM